MRIAKIIDWFACKLTPKTIYRPASNPFLSFEREKEKPFGFYAGMHLISMAVEANATELEVHVDGYSCPEGEFGDWIVTVTKKGT